MLLSLLCKTPSRTTPHSGTSVKRSRALTWKGGHAIRDPKFASGTSFDVEDGDPQSAPLGLAFSPAAPNVRPALASRGTPGPLSAVPANAMARGNPCHNSISVAHQSNKKALMQGFFDGRYWARTSDPSLSSWCSPN